jgi:hypothetical protein
VGSKYPGALSSLVRENAESPRVKEAVARRASLPLSAQLRFHRLNGYYLHRLFRAKRAAFAELGAVPVCPAFFMPPVPRRERWVNDRTLLRAASGEAVPDEVWARPKVKNQSILPSAWREEITGALSPLAHAACERMSVRGEAGEALRRHFGKDLGVLELWARVFEGQTPALDRLFPGL